jgi:hypothetical protein
MRVAGIAPSPLRFNRHTECSPLARGGLGPIRRGRDVCLSAGGGGRCKNPGAPDTAERSVSCGEFSTSADFRSFGWLCGAVGLVLFAFVLSEPPLLHCIWDLELEFGKSCSQLNHSFPRRAHGASDSGASRTQTDVCTGERRARALTVSGRGDARSCVHCVHSLCAQARGTFYVFLNATLPSKNDRTCRRASVHARWPYAPAAGGCARRSARGRGKWPAGWRR